jgi:hypothetical protein
MPKQTVPVVVNLTRQEARLLVHLARRYGWRGPRLNAAVQVQSIVRNYLADMLADDELVQEADINRALYRSIGKPG